MSIWFGLLFGVPPPPFSSAAPFEALMMMFFLRMFAPSPVGFGTPITTLFVGRLIKVDFDEPMDDDDDTDANKVAAHNPRIFLTRRRPPCSTPPPPLCVGRRRKKVNGVLDDAFVKARFYTDDDVFLLWGKKRDAFFL